MAERDLIFKIIFLIDNLLSIQNNWFLSYNLGNLIYWTPDFSKDALTITN